MTIALLAQNAALVGGFMTVLWLVSVWKRDASIVDPWWGIAFLVVTIDTAVATGLTPEKLLLLALVALWAIRLWLHLLLRSRGKGEDPRYAAFRQKFGPERYWWISFFQVFLLQGMLVLLISAPLVIAGSTPTPGSIRSSSWPGAIVFAIGFAVEVIADAQLQVFRSNTTRRSTVLDTGLWRYSRHPNYFGEALLWWGFWLFALQSPRGWITIFAPAAMTYLLVKVSGVAMLDAHLAATRPGFRDYMRRTSGFIPWPPRNASKSD